MGVFLSGGKNRCINIIPRKGDNSCWLCVVPDKNNPLSLSSSFLLAFFHRSLHKKKKRKNRRSLNPLNGYRSRLRSPPPIFLVATPVKAQLYSMSVDGVEGGGIARNREITTLRKKRQAFRARRNCFYSPVSSPGKPRQKIDLRYDDPKKPESGFYVCVVISGSARSPRQSLAGQKLKENSVSRKFLSPFLFLRQVNFVINR